jgi:hypothetical protein
MEMNNQLHSAATLSSGNISGVHRIGEVVIRGTGVDLAARLYQKSNPACSQSLY